MPRGLAGQQGICVLCAGMPANALVGGLRAHALRAHAVSACARSVAQGMATPACVHSSSGIGSVPYLAQVSQEAHKKNKNDADNGDSGSEDVDVVAAKVHVAGLDAALDLFRSDTHAAEEAALEEEVIALLAVRRAHKGPFLTRPQSLRGDCAGCQFFRMHGISSETDCDDTG
eukprot:CAMPEP_0171070126 /NCGR_PEP_ID=MMETSP0766_2-20121228/9556_1 /TAXON_ID=439317 /ORGANISM="Gambierdiscus australes, Strain CAWD 149" /LENGTH=172 /DNA_ID=CAMNT_0011526563 /DNA_START=150 /DNA_END=666 /DNA_ORIENTATION=-